MRAVFATLAFFIFLFAAHNASAANYIVTRIDDRNNATCAAGDCSLREAVKAANATAEADTITFNIPAANCNASTNVCTITLTTASGGEITIESAGGALTINGTGANRLTINGGGNRIFFSNGASATITGVTLTGGGGQGRDLYNFGEAGAISANGGTLILNSVDITANGASTAGGVFFYFGTNHQILNSTLSANTASGCGGFYNLNGTLTVINSTISGNRVTSGNGAGFCSSNFPNGSSITTLRNVTITNNSAPNGTGGILHSNGTLNLGNTIVAGNTSRDDSEFIIFENGTVTTAGYNLIGNNTNVSTIFPAGNPNANRDIVGTSAAPVNPMLGALTIANGGTTPTHSPLGNSPAIDRGNSFGFTTDQRGFLRPVDFATYPNASGGNGADIGAVELQNAPTAASVAISGRVMTESGRGIRNVRMTLTDASGNVRTATTTAFGYYRFADLAAGETYIITAFGKRYTFDQPSQVLNINGDLTDINFVGHSNFLFQAGKINQQEK